MKNWIYAVALLAASPLSAATVVNGSFELAPRDRGTFGADFASMNDRGRSWDVWMSLPGWHTGSGSGIEVQTDRTLRLIDAQDGDHYVELDSHGGSSNSSMYQDIFLTTGTYELSFFYSPRTRNPRSNGIGYSVTGNSETLLSDAVTGPNRDIRRRVWTEITDRFSVRADGMVRLSFSARGREDTLGGFIDNVSIAPVPLPAAGWMLLAGMVGLGAMRARRKS